MSIFRNYCSKKMHVPNLMWIITALKYRKHMNQCKFQSSSFQELWKRDYLCMLSIELGLKNKIYSKDKYDCLKRRIGLFEFCVQVMYVTLWLETWGFKVFSEILNMFNHVKYTLAFVIIYINIFCSLFI